MKERPILFSTPMVRAILDGRKTMTRRIVKPRKDPDFGCELSPSEIACFERPGGLCPYGEPGDRLWVRETWCPVVPGSWEPLDRREKMSPLWSYDAAYRADYPLGMDDYNGKWRPSIHLPRKFSRITLEITGVRVERLQDISEDDAKAEGVRGFVEGGCWVYEDYVSGQGTWNFSPKASFMSLWESINGAQSLAANPWVWVVSFRRIR